jgi:hypothetical protein
MSSRNKKPVLGSNVELLSNIFVRDLEQTVLRDQKFREQIRGRQAIKRLIQLTGLSLMIPPDADKLEYLSPTQRTQYKDGLTCPFCGRHDFGQIQIAVGSLTWGFLAEHGRACRCRRGTEVATT